MADVKDLEKKIEGKLRLLNFSAEETTTITGSKDLKAIERHVNVMQSIIDKIHELKVQVQGIKIEGSESATDVRVWSQDVETKVRKFEQSVNEVREVANHIKHSEKEKLEEIKCKQVLEEQIELEKAKLEVRSKFEGSLKSPSVSGLGAKLPKLIISKFQGTHLDWIRFWSQFETEIDKSTINQVAKFSYLRELLVPSARVLIDRRPSIHIRRL